MISPTSLLIVALSLCTEPTPYSERPRSFIAPSLPQLSREEEKALDELIDRFMRADVGALTGAEANQAVRDFQALGSESVPALIRGLNRAADINHTCPALQLSRKLMTLLSKSTDTELLEFARENIGAGVSDRSRHKGVFQQMRTELLLRKNALARLNPQPPRLTTDPPLVQRELGLRDPRSLPTAEIIRLLKTEAREPVQRLLRELETRKGQEVPGALASQIPSSDSDLRQLSRDLLLRHVGRMELRDLLPLLEHADVEVRRSTVETVLAKHATALPRLIDRLMDRDEAIRQQVRQALVREARPVDFGPEANADAADARKARDRWRTWWDLNRRN